MNFFSSKNVLKKKCCSEEKCVCVKPCEKWENVNVLSKGTTDLAKALTAYMLVLILSFLFMYFMIKTPVFAGFIFSIIVGQIFLNLIFIPTRYNIFSEFSNSNAFYILIQTFTPIIVYFYALHSSFKIRGEKRKF